MLQLLQTSETKTFIKRSFGYNEKLYFSKEVKEVPTKLLQRSNFVIDKNHRKSNAGMHRKRIGLMTSQLVACENMHFSSLFVDGDVSRRGTAATQRQKIPY